MEMKKKAILILVFIFMVLSPVQAAENTINISNNTSSYKLSFIPATNSLNSNLSSSGNISSTDNETVTNAASNNSQNSDDYSSSDMVSDAFAEGGDKLLVRFADHIYNAFGFIGGSIYSFITWNIDPSKLPVIEKFFQNNKLLAVPIVILLLSCECIAGQAAMTSPSTFSSVFGDRDYSNERYVGGIVLMLAGIGCSALFYAGMFLLNLVDSYLMLSVMGSIKPSADNAVMYFCLAIIELLLSIFFIYRQILIVIMYPLSPIYGVLYASGYCKEFIDAIGDRFVRALIMQPLCILVTIAGITVMKAFEVQVLGVTVWDADNEMLFYVALGYILYRTCKWCVYGNWSIVKRLIGLKKVAGML